MDEVIVSRKVVETELVKRTLTDDEWDDLVDRLSDSNQEVIEDFIFEISEDN